MLDLVKQETRIHIASAQRMAYRGSLTAAIGTLEKYRGIPSMPEVDLAAILSTKAELLFLDGELSAAHQVFDLELEPMLNSLPHAVAAAIAFNRVDVASALFDSEGISRVYDLFDEMRVTGIKHRDDSALLAASRQAAKGKSYDSLPAIWRELLRTYRQGQWSAFRDASRYMAEECIRIGEFADAAFHASVAGDSGTAKQIAAVLLDSQRIDAVTAVLEKLISTANLRLHFKVACALIQEASDAVPDQLVDQLVQWILPHCGSDKESEDHRACEQVAWKTIEALASRCTKETAQEIVTAATSHRAWSELPEKPNQFIRVREEIIDAVKQAVSALPEESLCALTDLVIPLATDRYNFNDYTNIVNLMAHIVSRGSESVRITLRDALYPKGKAIPPVLMQLAPHFGYEIVNKDDQLDKYAKTVKTNLSNVVQRVPKGNEPVPVNGTNFTWTSQKEHETLLVHYISTDDVHAMARNRKKFGTESLSGVIRALTKSISDPENVLENKLSFIECIGKFADVLSRDIAAEVYDFLAPIAIGQIDLSRNVPDGEQQHHPLSRMRFSGVTPAQVTGHALFVLARIECCMPDVFANALQSIVEASLSSISPEIRKSAFAAVREIPTLSERTWMPLIMGTRDPDVKAAAMAFDAIANKKNARLTRRQWRMLVYALRITQLCVSVPLRRAAAWAVTALMAQAPNKKTIQELENIRLLFANDIAFSVRCAAMVDG